MFYPPYSLLRLAAVAGICFLLVGCAGTKVSTISVSGKTHPIEAIAFAPDGGVLADAIGIELSNRGFQVIDSVTTSNIMVRLNLDEIEIAKPEGLAKLKDNGIDAFLTVRAVAGYDRQPQSASARINSTHTGKTIAGINWQNARSGAQGSIADGMMRKGLVVAATEIADALVKVIRPD